MTFKSYDDLVDEHGSGPQIPNAELYELLVAIKPDLVARLLLDQERDRPADEDEDKPRRYVKKVVVAPSLGPDSIPGSPLGQEVRRRCVADLKWLAKYFLWDAMPSSDGGLKPVTENIFLDPQYDVFAELFPKKDPLVPIKDLTPVKTQVLLWPRGGAKSSYDHVDSVQWVLAYPDIRILEYSGIDPVNALDVSTTATGNSVTSSSGRHA